MVPQYSKTWTCTQCLQAAANDVNKIGKRKLPPKTVSIWNVDYQNNEQSIHPLSLWKKSVTKLFSFLPEVIDKINKFCPKKEDLKQLSIEHTINHIVGEIIPSIYEGMKYDFIGDKKHPSA